MDKKKLRWFVAQNPTTQPDPRKLSRLFCIRGGEMIGARITNLYWLTSRQSLTFHQTTEYKYFFHFQFNQYSL